VKLNDEVVEGEATWNADSYCAVWVPYSISVWPVGATIHVSVNHDSISSDKGKMSIVHVKSKTYTCSFAEIELNVSCSDFEVLQRHWL
jgi:hypothetical protein